MGHPIDHIRTHLEIPPEMEQSLRSIMPQHTFKRGETISAISDMRSNVFYIQNGAARVYYLKSGKEHTYSFAFDDEFVTLSPYLWKTPDNIPTIEFLEPTEVIFVPIPGTHFLMQDYAREHLAEASTFLLTALIEHTHFLEERIFVLQTASATERYKWLINRYPKILERATITQIASYLGVTKETLYRIRAGKY